MWEIHFSMCLVKAIYISSQVLPSIGPGLICHLNLLEIYSGWDTMLRWKYELVASNTYKQEETLVRNTYDHAKEICNFIMNW